MDANPEVAPPIADSSDAASVTVAVFPSAQSAQPGAETTSVEQGVAQALVSLRDLRDLFEAKIRYDAVKNEQIRQLSDDARAAREGLNQRILRPLFLRLIELYDDMSKVTLPGATDIEDNAAAKLSSALHNFREMVEEILGEFGVVRYEVEGDDFIGERQRVIKKTETTNPSLDRKVIARLRPGFTYNDPVAAVGVVVLRPEWVEVYSYTPEA